MGLWLVLTWKARHLHPVPSMNHGFNVQSKSTYSLPRETNAHSWSLTSRLQLTIFLSYVSTLDRSAHCYRYLRLKQFFSKIIFPSMAQIWFSITWTFDVTIHRLIFEHLSFWTGFNGPLTGFNLKSKTLAPCSQHESWVQCTVLVHIQPSQRNQCTQLITD